MFFPQVVLILIKSISSRTLRIGINGGNCNSRSSTGLGNDSNLLIVFYVQIMPDDLVMQLHRF
ncbi:hypothetical protein B6J05_27540 [Klebsiella quasipneumoniae]|nr:hypothetical protein B6J05_27540 [Klebsiella quasipneumoniae]